jgi:hypothetical protein
MEYCIGTNISNHHAEQIQREPKRQLAAEEIHSGLRKGQKLAVVRLGYVSDGRGG